MGQRERAEAAEARRADKAQLEADLQRWADDGGFIPRPAARPVAPTRAHNPWVTVGVATGIGFALGRLTCRR